MKLHFTSLGEYAVDQLYLALKDGHDVSCVPDSIPEECEALVVGCSTHKDSADVAEASGKGIEVLSVAQVVYRLCEDKQRIVIAGSVGKSETTRIIIHVLETLGKEFDYAIGSPVNGNNVSVKISDAPIIIIEGAESPCSIIDKKPQFLRFKHHIVVITDLSHRHQERYPKFEKYVKQFDKLADATPKSGTIIYSEDDDLVTIIGGKERDDVRRVSFTEHPGSLSGNKAILKNENGEVLIPNANEFTLSHIAGAKELLKRLGVTNDQFYLAIESYKANN